MNHRPSAIAAAAVLAASSRKLTTKEMKVKMEVISSWVSLENVSFSPRIIKYFSFVNLSYLFKVKSEEALLNC